MRRMELINVRLTKSLLQTMRRSSSQTLLIKLVGKGTIIANIASVDHLGKARARRVSARISKGFFHRRAKDIYT